MMKYSLKVFTALLLLVSNAVFAGYIETDLTENTYITYGGYDWTWASSVNITHYEKTDFFTSEKINNTFEDASVHAGWMSFSEGSEIDKLFKNLTLNHFISNNTAIHSFQYWNSYFSAVDTVFQEGQSDFNPLVFELRSGVKDETGSFDNNETFYVRTSALTAAAAAPATVPEPSTLFIFAVGLLGFSLRKRNLK